MAAFAKYDDTVEQIFRGVHQLHAAGHTVKAAIHSDAPAPTTDDELADLTQQAGTDGYTTGGEDIENDVTVSGGTAQLVSADTVEWTAAGTWAAMQYVSLHNDSSTTDKLLGSWNYGTPFTLTSGETFTVDFGATVCTLT